MRILIEPGSYRCQNMGDVAMLQVAVRRLSHVFPGATIGVFTGDAARLGEYCPGVRPVPSEGRAVWLAERRWLPGSAAPVPGRLRHLGLSLALRLRGRDRGPLEAFLGAIDGADLLVVCGQGSMGDATAEHAMTVLATLELARGAGLRTAMLGQGIGPLGGPALRRRAAAVLPGVELIALREGLAGPGLLRDLGVAAERVVVTGDDAIELAYARGPADAGEDVGVNIRVSGNSGVESAAVAGLASAVRSFLERRRVGMVPVPIARGQAHDAVVLEDFARTVGAPLCGTLDPATPGAVVQQLGRCRILVTGAYHAAVFALSRGIPVVCLSNSEYYHHKFDGLAAQFGTGCWQVRLDGSAAEHLTSAMESAWRDAPSLREPLRRAAAAQVALGREAYQRLERLAPTAGARTMNRVPA